jgi:large repetitive protein
VRVLVVENIIPIADAGLDQQVKIGETVSLSAEGSRDGDGDPLTFRWLIPDGDIFREASERELSVSFAEVGVYSVTLIVSDGKADSEPSVVKVTVTAPPVPPPGDTEIVITGDTVPLSGLHISGLSISPASLTGVRPGDEVELTVSGVGLSEVKQFAITLEVSPEDAFDLPATTFSPNEIFTIAPGVDFLSLGRVQSGAASLAGPIEGDAELGTFKLHMSSNFNSSTSAIIKVAAISIGPTSTDRDNFSEDELGLGLLINSQDGELQDNNRPIANAGEDVVAHVGDLIQFDGSKSADVDGDPLTFKWRIPSSSFDVIYEGVNPTHQFNKIGTYTVTLRVNDGKIDSEPDVVIVRIDG